jgi:hypothetical protein
VRNTGLVSAPGFPKKQEGLERVETAEYTCSCICIVFSPTVKSEIHVGPHRIFRDVRWAPRPTQREGVQSLPRLAEDDWFCDIFIGAAI